jgi:hypothetical protein
MFQYDDKIVTFLPPDTIEPEALRHTQHVGIARAGAPSA